MWTNRIGRIKNCLSSAKHAFQFLPSHQKLPRQTIWMKSCAGVVEPISLCRPCFKSHFHQRRNGQPYHHSLSTMSKSTIPYHHEASIRSQSWPTLSIASWFQQHWPYNYPSLTAIKLDSLTGWLAKFCCPGNNSGTINHQIAHHNH